MLGYTNKNVQACIHRDYDEDNAGDDDDDDD